MLRLRLLLFRLKVLKRHVERVIPPFDDQVASLRRGPDHDDSLATMQSNGSAGDGLLRQLSHFCKNYKLIRRILNKTKLSCHYPNLGKCF